jgi:hypothetical protein
MLKLCNSDIICKCCVIFLEYIPKDSQNRSQHVEALLYDYKLLHLRIPVVQLLE